MGRKGFLYFILIVLLSGCSVDQTDTADTGELRLPSSKQIGVVLPKILTHHELVSNETGLTPADHRLSSADTKSKVNNTAKTAAKSIQISANTNTESTWVLNPYLTGGFDPFFIGENGTQENAAATQTSCPGSGPEEPRSIDGINGGLFGPNGIYQGMCFSRAIQIALKRIVSDYSTAITVITAVAHNFKDVAPNITHRYTHSTIATNSGTGLTVRYRYECADFCSDSNMQNRSYAYSLAFEPLSQPGEIVGRTDWTVHGDGRTTGSMTINSGMMAPMRDWAGINPQVQYTFESDAQGVAKTFEMKFSPNRNDEFFHDASYVRLERKPGDGTIPDTWIVQGEVAYTISLAENPAQAGREYHGEFGTMGATLLFTAIAEDELIGGRAVYNAILAGGPGLPKRDEIATTANPLEELHLWAAYKKMLEELYTERFYEIKGLAGTASLMRFAGPRYFIDMPRYWADVELPEGDPWTRTRKHARSVLAQDSDTLGRWLVSGLGNGVLTIRDFNYDRITSPLGLRNCTPYGYDTSGIIGINDLSVSDDGSKILLVNTQGVVKLLNLDDCSELSTVSIVTPASCNDEFRLSRMHRIQFNPADNSEFFTVSPGVSEATFRKWQITTNQSLTEIASKTVFHQSLYESTGDPNTCMGATGLDISLNGRYLISGFYDATARLIDMDNNSELVYRHEGLTSGEDTVGVTAMLNDSNNIVVTGAFIGGSGLYHWQRYDIGVDQRVEEVLYEQKVSDESVGLIKTTQDKQRFVAFRNVLLLPHLRNGLPTQDSHYNNTPIYYSINEVTQGDDYIATHAYGEYATHATHSAYILPPYNEILYIGNAMPPMSESTWIYPFNIMKMGFVGKDKRIPFVSQAPTLHVSFNSEGSHVLATTMDGKAHLYRFWNGAKIQQFEGHGASQADPLNTFVNTGQFVHNDSKILTAGADHTARLWDLEGNTLDIFGEAVEEPCRHTDIVNAAQATTDFTKVVTASDDGSLIFWVPFNQNFCVKLANAHNGREVKYVTFSPVDEIAISVGYDARIRKWDTTLVPPVLIDEIIHEYFTTYVEFSPDGQRFSVGYWNGRVDVYRTATMELITTLKHQDCVPEAGACTRANGNNGAFSQVDNGNEMLVNIAFFAVGSNVNQGHKMRLFDIDELSPTFGEEQHIFVDNMINTQEKQQLTSGRFHPLDNNHKIAGYTGGAYNPLWTDFDALWNYMRQFPDEVEEGFWALPGEQANPYFLEPHTTGSETCFLLEDPNQSDTRCSLTCGQIPGGCTAYRTISTYRHNNLGPNSPIAETRDEFDNLVSVMNGLEQPFYPFERFTAEALQGLP